MSRVPITGIGVIAPGAIGVEAFRELLASGERAIVPVDRFDVNGLTAQHAALVRGFKPKELIPPMKMRRMSALSRLGVAAAKLAADDHARPLSANTGVAVGTAFGTVQTSVDYMQEYVEKGASLAPPQLFAESVANAAGSHVAIEHDLRGFNITITQRESSALAAAMYAASQVLKGTVDAALIGGVEEATEMLFSVLDRLGALSPEPAKPYARGRGGMTLGEGGAMLVAGGEGRRTYAWLSGFGIARDTTASISNWGSDEKAIVAAMTAALEDSNLSIESIDAVYGSGNGSRRGDEVEARAIRALFGERVPVVATKGIFGEYAAAGALQLIAAILAIDEQALHASSGCGDDTLIPVNREYRKTELRHVLVNSVSAGGGIVSAVVSR
jgi:3-oxoacyl-[acyl-carrier-protein] synthase II